MGIKKLSDIKSILIIYFFLVFSLRLVVAINTVNEGYRIDPGNTIHIDAHGICKDVTNSGGISYFIPTRTSNEWSFFRTAAASIPDLSLANCCIPDCSCAANTCIGSTCSDGCTGTCSGTKICCTWQNTVGSASGLETCREWLQRTGQIGVTGTNPRVVLGGGKFNNRCVYENLDAFSGTQNCLIWDPNDWMWKRLPKSSCGSYRTQTCR